MSRCWTASGWTDEVVHPSTSRSGFRTLLWHASILETKSRAVCDAAAKISRKFQNETEVGSHVMIGSRESPFAGRDFQSPNHHSPNRSIHTRSPLPANIARNGAPESHHEEIVT